MQTTIKFLHDNGFTYRQLNSFGKIDKLGAEDDVFVLFSNKPSTENYLISLGIKYNDEYYPCTTIWFSDIITVKEFYKSIINSDSE